MQSRIPVVLEEVPETIANEIVADKRWLMESILTMIDNGSKFSQEGPVRAFEITYE